MARTAPDRRRAPRPRPNARSGVYRPPWPGCKEMTDKVVLSFVESTFINCTVCKERIMSTSEQERVQQALKDHAEGNAAAETLEYDGSTGRIRAAGHYDPDQRSTKYTAEDFGFSCNAETVCHDRARR